MAFKKILCAIDFSACSREAMKTAARLAVEGDAELILQHVLQLPSYLATTDMGMTADTTQALVSDAETNLGAWTQSAHGLGVKRVTPVFVVGLAWDTVVDVTNRDPAIDLVVVGTHGRTGIKHVILGSVAEKIARHARCSVLVVR